MKNKDKKDSSKSQSSCCAPQAQKGAPSAQKDKNPAPKKK